MVSYNPPAHPQNQAHAKRAPGMRRTPKDRQRQLAKLAVVTALEKLQDDNDMTDLEMMEALTEWYGTHVKYMLRAERGQA